MTFSRAGWIRVGAAVIVPETLPSILDALKTGARVVAAELRPPRAELEGPEGMDAWIDTYHAVHRLTRSGTHVFLTDSAVGTQEEDNLRHLVANLGGDVSRARVVPFLTAKHTREYCLSYAERAAQHGFPAMVVLGGDRSLGAARCVEHAWQLRAMIREHVPGLVLGGWANPNTHAEAQAAYLRDPRFTAEFYLTQIVSHHDLGPVARFVDVCRREDVVAPGLFGVFYYRSSNARTLSSLGQFLPVPAEQLSREFGEGATPQAVCARTIRALFGLGIEHVYVSNLPLGRASHTLTQILELVEGEGA
jgi:5,10-methylenetetrahydrofolate reductase